MPDPSEPYNPVNPENTWDPSTMPPPVKPVVDGKPDTPDVPHDPASHPVDPPYDPSVPNSLDQSAYMPPSPHPEIIRPKSTIDNTSKRILVKKIILGTVVTVSVAVIGGVGYFAYNNSNSQSKTGSGGSTNSIARSSNGQTTNLESKLSGMLDTGLVKDDSDIENYKSGNFSVPIIKGTESFGILTNTASKIDEPADINNPDKYQVISYHATLTNIRATVYDKSGNTVGSAVLTLDPAIGGHSGEINDVHKDATSVRDADVKDSEDVSIVDNVTYCEKLRRNSIMCSTYVMGNDLLDKSKYQFQSWVHYKMKLVASPNRDTVIDDDLLRQELVNLYNKHIKGKIVKR